MLRHADDASSGSEENDASGKSGRVVAVASAAAATGALACTVCGVLPFALPALVLAGTGGLIAWLAQAQGWMMWTAVAAVAAGWLWIGLHSLRHRAWPATPTIGVMVADLAARSRGHLAAVGACRGGTADCIVWRTEAARETDRACLVPRCEMRLLPERSAGHCAPFRSGAAA